MSCRYGRGPLARAAAVLAKIESSNQEIQGLHGDLHVRARVGGCLDIHISKAEPEHKDCAVKRRTFGAPEEALGLWRYLIEKLPEETQLNLFDFLRSKLETPLKNRARR